MSAHTPGPWECVAANWDRCGEGQVAYVIGMPDAAASKANARVIEAAPDLLWALQQIVSDLPTAKDWLDPNLEAFARNVIAKATGETK